MLKRIKQLSLKNLLKTSWANQFNDDQLKEIIIADKLGLDINKIANPKLSSKKMNALVFGLHNNIDLTPYAGGKTGYKQLDALVYALMDGFSVDDFKLSTEKFMKHQIIRSVVRYKREGFDLLPYAKQGFSDNQLILIYSGLFRNIDVTIYANTEYSYEIMHELYTSLINDYYNDRIHDYLPLENYQNYDVKAIIEMLNHNADNSSISDYLNATDNISKKIIHDGVVLGFDYKQFTENNIVR